MRSRALAVVLSLVSLGAFVAAAFFVRISEQHIASERAEIRAFDAAIRDATSNVLEFDSARTSASLMTLRSMARTDRARASIDSAVATVTDLTDIAPILNRLDEARSVEANASDEREASKRKVEAMALAAAAGVGLIAVALLTVAWPRPESSAETAVDLAAEATSPSAYTTARQPGPVLREASRLCTNLGRVSDVEELRQLVGDAADLIDASGLIVWMGAPGGAELRPALSHGYSSELMSRLPAVPRTADNAAARAFRTGQLQIVLARPGSSNGAVVAPLLTSAGCVGVVSAEIRGGGESSETVQALAEIFAAQLATVVPSAPQVQAERAATGTGGA